MERSYTVLEQRLAIAEARAQAAVDTFSALISTPEAKTFWREKCINLRPIDIAQWLVDFGGYTGADVVTIQQNGVKPDAMDHF